MPALVGIGIVSAVPDRPAVWTSSFAMVAQVAVIGIAPVVVVQGATALWAWVRRVPVPVATVWLPAFLLLPAAFGFGFGFAGAMAATAAQGGSGLFTWFAVMGAGLYYGFFLSVLIAVTSTICGIWRVLHAQRTASACPEADDPMADRLT